ncbi:MAG: hypothetical protein FJZ86_18900 [Chloroflexi bacterium]|nr:hypothetical protein [Chloroflexota bacterium]
MNQRTTVFMLVLLLVSSGCGAPASTADPTQASGEQVTCMPAPGETVEIADAKLIIEYNFTARDIGVHGLFDDHGWSELCVYDPNGVQVLAVKPQSQLKDLTMAGIFFESREPPEAEFSFDDLKARFPEGQYEVRGRNWDGTWLRGFATFMHDVPLAPTVIFPALAAEEENAGDVVVPLDGLVIEWADVTATVDGGSVTIAGYEIIITKVEHDDPHGFSQPIYDVHVPPDRNSLSVPIEFLEPRTVYELEVLALEESGNQTITSGFFKTE